MFLFEHLKAILEVYQILSFLNASYEEKKPQNEKIHVE
jgi:hypothetical protein